MMALSIEFDAGVPAADVDRQEQFVEPVGLTARVARRLLRAVARHGDEHLVARPGCSGEQAECIDNGLPRRLARHLDSIRIAGTDPVGEHANVGPVEAALDQHLVQQPGVVGRTLEPHLGIGIAGDGDE